MVLIEVGTGTGTVVAKNYTIDLKLAGGYQYILYLILRH